MDDRSLGIILIAVPSILLAVAFYLLFLAPESITLLTTKLILFGLLCAILGLLIWIGFTLLTVKLPRAPTEGR